MTASSRPSTASRSRSSGPDARDRRRVRLRQERHLPDDHGPEPEAEHHHLRSGAVEGRGPADDEREQAAGHPRQRHRDDLPGPDDEPEPGAPDREAADRGDHAPRRRVREAGAPDGARAAEGGRHPARGAPDRRLPAPVLRRDAPARDDRDGADQQPGPAGRRRAHHGARRDDAGADPEPAREAAAGLRQRDHHDHPRPGRDRGDRRRRGRHVRRGGRRGGLRRGRSSSGRITPTRGASWARCPGSTPTSSASSRSRVSRRRSSTRRRAVASIRAART